MSCPHDSGEYDSRSPVELVYDFYNKIEAPKELWVYEDTYQPECLVLTKNDMINT